MLASNNIMSPARQSQCDSKDMGGISYYLTAENPNGQRGWAILCLLDDAIMAYEQQSDLHAFVWVRFDG